MSAIHRTRRSLLALLVLVVLLAVGAAISGSSSLEAPADLPRVWATDDYEALFAPDRPTWPTLGGAPGVGNPVGPAPTLAVHATDRKLEVQLDWSGTDMPGGRGARDARQFGPARAARLGEWTPLGAGPQRIRLALWGTRRGDEVHLFDPSAGTWVSDPGEVEWIGKPGRKFLGNAGGGDGILLVTETDGGPVRLGGYQAYDRDTHARLGKGSTWSTIEGHTFSVVRTLPGHRAPWTVVVPVAHGEPRVATVDLQPGERIAFEDDTELEVLGVLEGYLQSHGGGVSRATVETDGGESGLAGRTVVLRCWPMESEHRLLVRAPGEERWSTLGSVAGPVVLARLPEGATQLELCLLESGSLVHVELEPPPHLPRVENLFDLPLGRFRADSAWDLQDRLEDLVQAAPGSLGNLELADHLFPLELEDVTPMDLVTWLREHDSRPLGWRRGYQGFTRDPMSPATKVLTYLRERWDELF